MTSDSEIAPSVADESLRNEVEVWTIGFVPSPADGAYKCTPAAGSTIVTISTARGYRYSTKDAPSRTNVVTSTATAPERPAINHWTTVRIGIGERSPFSPATPPEMRVRFRRLEDCLES